MVNDRVAGVIRFYHELTPQTLARLPEVYSADASFKDPFHEVRGLPAIHRIFSRMFEQLVEPRFEVTAQAAQGVDAMLVWEFRYRRHAAGRHAVIRGASHLRFDAGGKVCMHRDYWDAAEELYMTLPVIGAVMRGLRRRIGG